MWANIGWEWRAEGIQIVFYYLFILFHLNRQTIARACVEFWDEKEGWKDVSDHDL